MPIGVESSGNVSVVTTVSNILTGLTVVQQANSTDLLRLFREERQDAMSTNTDT